MIRKVEPMEETKKVRIPVVKSKAPWTVKGKLKNFTDLLQRPVSSLFWDVNGKTAPLVSEMNGTEGRGKSLNKEELQKRREDEFIVRTIRKLPDKQQSCFINAKHPMGLNDNSFEVWVRNIFLHRDPEIREKLKREIHGYLDNFVDSRRKIDKSYNKIKLSDLSAEEKKRKLRELSKKKSSLDRTLVTQKRYLQHCRDLIELSAIRISTDLRSIEEKTRTEKAKKWKLFNADETNKDVKEMLIKIGKGIADAVPRVIIGVATIGGGIAILVRNLDWKKIMSWIEQTIKHKDILEPSLIMIGAISGSVIAVVTGIYVTMTSIDWLFNIGNQKRRDKLLIEYDRNLQRLEKEREERISHHISAGKSGLRLLFLNYRKALCRIDDPYIGKFPTA